MPASYPLALYQGDTTSIAFAFSQDGAPLDLRDAIAAAEVRARPGGDAILLVFDCSIPAAAPHNVVELRLPADAWAGYVAGNCEGAWDLQLTYPSDGTVWTPIAGPARITADVTDTTGGLP